VVAGVPGVFGGQYSPVWLDEEVRGQAEGGVPVPGGGRAAGADATQDDGVDPTLLSSADGGSLVRVIAGELAEHRGPGATHTPLALMHATVSAGALHRELLVLGCQPIREPVAHYDPFVMNTRIEVMQALEDFQAGRFGTIPPNALMPHVPDPDPIRAERTGI